VCANQKKIQQPNIIVMKESRLTKTGGRAAEHYSTRRSFLSQQQQQQQQQH
jgi:hypothetical protein